jgi:glyoxylase-like metal-dependent hydrolase (beta-lactamase superfamily II)
MRISAEKQLNERIRIAGHPIYPGYLIRGSSANIMIEAGLNILGPAYLGEAQKFFGSAAGLDSLLVTHGHYEHMGALPYLKRNIPALDLRAHPVTSGLLEKEKVVKVMNFLSRETWGYFEGLREEDAGDVEIRPVPFGKPLKEGDVISLGDWNCEVLETPGHTQDHLSFFLPEPGILFPGEALGNPVMQTEEQVKIEFLTSYAGYLDSMQKLIAMLPRVRVIAMSHLYYYTGEDVPRFMKLALDDTLRYRELIEQYLDMANGDVELAKSTMLRVEYDEKRAVYQERNAYAVNLGAQIKAVAALRTAR